MLPLLQNGLDVSAPPLEEAHFGLDRLVMILARGIEFVCKAPAGCCAGWVLRFAAKASDASLWLRP